MTTLSQRRGVLGRPPICKPPPPPPPASPPAPPFAPPTNLALHLEWTHWHFWPGEYVTHTSHVTLPGTAAPLGRTYDLSWTTDGNAFHAYASIQPDRAGQIYVDLNGADMGESPVHAQSPFTAPDPWPSPLSLTWNDDGSETSVAGSISPA